MPSSNYYCSATTIASNIYARRRALRIPRRQLSAALGYHDNGQYFERIERHGQSVPAEYLPAIAKELQVKDFRDFFVENRFPSS